MSAQWARVGYGLRKRLLLLAGAGDRAKRFDEEQRYLFRYYEGPYPLFYSGLMFKGGVNTDLVRYLKLTRRLEIIRPFLDAARKQELPGMAGL
jgi:hypothetical protein